MNLFTDKATPEKAARAVLALVVQALVHDKTEEGAALAAALAGSAEQSIMDIAAKLDPFRILPEGQSRSVVVSPAARAALAAVDAAIQSEEVRAWRLAASAALWAGSALASGLEAQERSKRAGTGGRETGRQKRADGRRNAERCRRDFARLTAAGQSATEAKETMIELGWKRSTIYRHLRQSHEPSA